MPKIIENIREQLFMLIASFMAQDWKQFLECIDSDASEDTKEILKNVVAGLSDFMQKYRLLFSDPDEVKVYADVFAVRHQFIREQLARIIKPICMKSSVEDKDFLAEWIAESLLTWTAVGKDFEEQYKITPFSEKCVYMYYQRI